MTAVAVVPTPCSKHKPHPANRTPHLRQRTAPSPTRRLRRSERHRAEAQRPSGSTHRAYIGPAEAEHNEPHGTSGSQLAEANRPVLPALRMLVANDKREARNTRASTPATEAAASAREASLAASTAFAHKKSSVLRDPVQIQRRLIAAATRQAHYSTLPKQHTARSGSFGRESGDGRASTSVPNQRTIRRRRAEPHIRSNPLEHTRRPKALHVSAAETAGT
jgi:hypothetical protein